MSLNMDESRNSTDYPMDEGDEEKTTRMRATPRQPPKKRHERNPDFTEYEATGLWGRVSNLEVVTAVVVLSMVIAGVVVGLFYLLQDNGDDVSTGTSTASPETIVDEAVFSSSTDHYSALVKEIQKVPAVADVILANFDTANEMNLLPVDAYTRAALWLINDDVIETKRKADLLPRFVLTVTYFANGGQQWKSSGNWLTDVNVCQWDGVVCDTAGKLHGIELSDNNLVGEIHSAWPFLKTCRSIHLNTNKLDGTIPGEAFGSMNELTYLYLQNNQLTGTIPVELRNGGTLKTLFLQGNLLEGEWPLEFCPNELNMPLNEFGIDCSLVECSCCVPILNCFNS